MESKKRRMLDPGVIRGKETERGEEEKVQLEKKRFGIRGRKNIIATQQGCNEFVSVFLARHTKLIGAYFSPHVEWVLMCHILPDGRTTSRAFSHSPSFNPDKDEDTKKLGGLVSSKRAR